ncbi:hypothetical protein BGZ83_006501 [Gryganskiella cystojenkinii]|nr:hypothetical protein BGZ83_006501 [Gryganskiella cystojenkinii]
MADNQEQQHQQEQQNIIVEEEEQQFSIAIVPEEGATIEPEPALITETSDKDQAAVEATTTVATATKAKQSRLSLAFHKISCGLCFHPLKNNSGVDYHQLVHTPTDEEGPFFGEDHPDGADHVEGITVASRDITEDARKIPKAVEQNCLLEASSSSSHAETAHPETKEQHLQLQQKGQAPEEDVSSEGQKEIVIPTFVEEFAVMEEPSGVATEEPTIVAREIVKDIPIQTVVNDAETISIPKQDLATSVITPVVTPSSSPAPVRAAGPFAKLTKRSSPSSSPTSSSPSSANSSPLLERLGRFAKIIRPSETTTSSFQTSTSSRSTSSQKVVESLQVVSSRTENGQTSVEETTSTTVKDTSSVQLTDAPASPVVFTDKKEQAQIAWSSATPPLPPTHQQPQQPQQVNKRHSLALDTAAANFVTSSSPVPIPGQSPIHPWTTHSPTLHQNDASIASQATANHTGSASINSTRSMSRAGRSSTVDSTVEGGAGQGSDVGSLSSSTKDGSASNSQQNEKGGFMSKTTKRRKSVMKKLGKIINNINTKPGKEGGKRVSRQGSMTLESPLEMSLETE